MFFRKTFYVFRPYRYFMDNIINDLHFTLPKVGEVEVEARVGSQSTDANFFKSSIDRESWLFHYKSLSLYGNWKKVIPPREERNFFFQQNGVEIRSTVGITSEGVKSQSIIKKVAGKKNVQLVYGNVKQIIRLSVSEETKIDPAVASVETTLVRIKHKSSFISESVRYDLSLVWTGKTLTDALQNQKTVCPLYEIECEAIETLDVKKALKNVMFGMLNLFQVEGDFIWI